MDQADLVYIPDELKFIITSYLDSPDTIDSLICIWELPLLDSIVKTIIPESLKSVDKKIYPYIVYKLEEYKHGKIDKNISLLMLDNIKNSDVYELPEILSEIKHLERLYLDLKEINNIDTFNFMLEILGNITYDYLKIKISGLCMREFDKLVETIKKTSARYLCIENNNLDFYGIINLKSLKLEGLKLRVNSFTNLILPETILYLDISGDLIGSEKIKLDVTETKLREMNVPFEWFDCKESGITKFTSLREINSYSESLTVFDKKTGQLHHEMSTTNYTKLKISESETPINLIFGEKSLLSNPKMLKCLEIERQIEYLGFYSVIQENSRFVNKIFSAFGGYDALKDFSFIYSNINYFLDVPGIGIVNLLPNVEELTITFNDCERYYESKIIIPASVHKLTLILDSEKKLNLCDIIIKLIKFENINNILYLSIEEYTERRVKTIINKSDFKKLAEIFRHTNISSFKLLIDLVDENGDMVLLEDLLTFIPESVVILQISVISNFDFIIDFRRFSNLKNLALNLPESKLFEKYIIKLPETLLLLRFFYNNNGEYVCNKKIILPGIFYCYIDYCL